MSRHGMRLHQHIRTLSIGREGKKSSTIKDIIDVMKVMHSNGEEMVLPSTYVVPRDEKYPSHLQGEQLFVSDVRRKYKEKKLDSAYIQELDALSFVWDVNLYKSEQRVQALTTYKSIHGNVAVPRSFIIPREEPWKKSLWDISLGSIVHRLRTGQLGIHPSHEEAFESLGFISHVHELKFNHHFSAFEEFISLHGHPYVPQQFVIPHDEMWPLSMHGLKLGRIVGHWRTSASTMSSDRFIKLHNAGFSWNPMDDNWSLTLTALTVYQFVHGDTLVPKNFVVPSDDDTYPEECWGIKLGSIANSIRTRMDDIPSEHREALDYIGFIWDPLEHQWDQVVLALRTHNDLFGHLRIATSFKIPINDQAWPRELWGLRLGSLVTQIRHRADIMATEQSELLATIVLTEEQDLLEEDS